MAIFVNAHLRQKLYVGDAIPDEIETAMTRSDVVVESGNRIADDLLLRRQKEREIRKDIFQCAWREIGLVRGAAPNVITSVDRLHVRQDLRANARAYAVCTDENVGILDTAIREMHA